MILCKLVRIEQTQIKKPKIEPGGLKDILVQNLRKFQRKAIGKQEPKQAVGQIPDHKMQGMQTEALE